MNDPFRHLERVQRELGEIALQLTQAQFTPFGSAAWWRPAVNAFRCTNGFVICLELAGTEKHSIQVLAEPHRLIVRGTRPPVEPGCDQPQTMQVLAMEIDHGPFERILELPEEVNPDEVDAEQREGVLWIRLPLRPPA